MIQIDMPMPDNCLECRFNTSEFGYCNAMPIEFVGQVSDSEEDGKPEWCPLKAQEPMKPVPAIDDVSDWLCANCYQSVVGEEELDASGFVPVKFNFCPNCGRAVKWE